MVEGRGSSLIVNSCIPTFLHFHVSRFTPGNQLRVILVLIMTGEQDRLSDFYGSNASWSTFPFPVFKELSDACNDHREYGNQNDPKNGDGKVFFNERDVSEEISCR